MSKSYEELIQNDEWFKNQQRIKEEWGLDRHWRMDDRGWWERDFGWGPVAWMCQDGDPVSEEEYKSGVCDTCPDLIFRLLM